MPYPTIMHVNHEEYLIKSDLNGQRIAVYFYWGTFKSPVIKHNHTPRCSYEVSAAGLSLLVGFRKTKFTATIDLKYIQLKALEMRVLYCNFTGLRVQILICGFLRKLYTQGRSQTSVYQS